MFLNRQLGGVYESKKKYVRFAGDIDFCPPTFVLLVMMEDKNPKL